MEVLAPAEELITPQQLSISRGESSDPSLHYISTDSSDLPDRVCLQPASLVPKNNHQKKMMMMSSPPQSLRRPCSEALSRTNSQASLISDAYAQDLPHNFVDGTHENDWIFPRPHTNKLRRIEWGSIDHQILDGMTGGLCLDSTNIRNLNRNKPDDSPFSFDSPIHKSLIHVETSAAVSPGSTSVGSEKQSLQSGSSSIQSFTNDDELYPTYVCSSSKSHVIHGREELLSGRSELLCSDNSVSSEVLYSPEACDLNQLMDFMLDDLHKEVSAKESVPTAMTNPYCSSSSEKPVGLFSVEEIDPKIKDNPLLIEEQNELIGGAIPQGNQHEIFASQSGFSVESCLMQDHGMWEPSGLEEVIAHSNLSTRKYSEGAVAVAPSEDNWLYPHSPQNLHCADAIIVERGDPFPKRHCMKKHDSDHTLKDEITVGNPRSGSENHEMQGMLKFRSGSAPIQEGFGNLRFGDNIKEFGEMMVLQSHLATTIPPQVGIRCEADYSGIRLVHLLIAAAEAVASRDMDLASVILVRLKELVFVSGSTMQRVAACFKDGLQGRIEGGRLIERASNNECYSEILAAFQILHEIFPYIKFGHFTANQAILEAIEGEKRVHIVDYEIMEGMQWPSFMQALVTRKGGAPHLRITALCRPHGKRGLATVQETGKRLSEFAASLHLPFTFNQLRIDNEEEFRPSAVKLIKGEALIVNCMLHLPHMPYRTATSVSSFLRGMHKLYPLFLTLVEDELGCCNTLAISSYFFEALHHYSAIFDSLEACLASELSSAGRLLVERVFLAPRITSAVSFCGGAASMGGGGGDSAKCNWFSLVNSAGFKPSPLSFHNLSQARLLLGLFKDGFKLEETGHRLRLGWRSTPLIAASAWHH